MPPLPSRWLRFISLVLVASAVASCRAAWQQPDRVIAGLALHRGERVADLGAGPGYFTFRLADAVGPEGRVFAVEVDPAKVEALRQQATERGYTNVEARLGAFDDARLPAASVDVVFLCNVYHHIDGRPAYFAKLREALAPGGRVAIVELADRGLVGVFMASHTTEVDVMNRELTEAGYRMRQRLDDLPAQTFTTWEVAPSH